MVDIVIPTYNNYTELKTCLTALSYQTVEHFQVWVAVDGSSDETLQQLPQFTEQLPYKVFILEHVDKQNHGRSCTRNLAINHIKNTFVWLLDSDMIPKPKCLETHLQLCTQYKNAISVGAIEYQNISKNIWAKYISTRGHAKFKHTELLPWNYFVTANSLIPSKYFIELDGFDEGIVKYGGEDMEFAYRMHLNYKASFYKNDFAICTTIQEKTLSKALVQLQEYGREGLPYIYQKHKNMPKIYHLDKLDGNIIKKTFYNWITLPLWSKIIRPLVALFPFFIHQYLISYLIICSILNGYKNQKKNL